MEFLMEETKIKTWLHSEIIKGLPQMNKMLHIIQQEYFKVKNFNLLCLKLHQTCVILVFDEMFP